MTSLIAHNEPAPLEGLEACDQTHISLFAANLVPRQPEAIGNAKFRFAFVLDELLRWKHVAPSGTVVGRLSIVLVEGVNHELTFDTNRLGSIAIVEEEPPTKSAFAPDLRIVPHCLGPGPHQTFGSRLARFLLPFPGERHFGHRGKRFAACGLATDLGKRGEEHGPYQSASKYAVRHLSGTQSVGKESSQFHNASHPPTTELAAEVARVWVTGIERAACSQPPAGPRTMRVRPPRGC